ncbi:hypothetical protein ACFWNT_06810 [Streptomyces sp. NPDC058409]|uniref:hypothetical protein n=1 Tax=Streptomyces sp. NPDC058409 TaxID=3346484 RepID=UPI003661B940
MRITFAGDWAATVTSDPLTATPRFEFRDFRVRVGTYTDVKEWQRFLTDTFGSQSWINHPVIYEVEDREPAALSQLRALDEALRNQHEDRHRADALLALISNLAKDYADRPPGQKP